MSIGLAGTRIGAAGRAAAQWAGRLSLGPGLRPPPFFGPGSAHGAARRLAESLAARYLPGAGGLRPRAYLRRPALILFRRLLRRLPGPAPAAPGLAARPWAAGTVPGTWPMPSPAPSMTAPRPRGTLPERAVPAVPHRPWPAPSVAFLTDAQDALGRTLADRWTVSRDGGAPGPTTPPGVPSRGAIRSHPILSSEEARAAPGWTDLGMRREARRGESGGGAHRPGGIVSSQAAVPSNHPARVMPTLRTITGSSPWSPQWARPGRVIPGVPHDWGRRIVRGSESFRSALARAFGLPRVFGLSGLDWRVQAAAPRRPHPAFASPSWVPGSPLAWTPASPGGAHGVLAPGGLARLALPVADWAGRVLGHVTAVAQRLAAGRLAAARDRFPSPSPGTQNGETVSPGDRRGHGRGRRERSAGTGLLAALSRRLFAPGVQSRREFERRAAARFAGGLTRGRRDRLPGLDRPLPPGPRRRTRRETPGAVGTRTTEAEVDWRSRRGFDMGMAGVGAADQAARGQARARTTSGEAGEAWDVRTSSGRPLSRLGADSPGVEAGGSREVSRETDPAALRADLRRRGGEGMALESALRTRLQRALGFDPAEARLHRGPVAADAARRLRAEAFAIGRDIFFGEGRFDTTSGRGLALLAHELTHVGQQARRPGGQVRFWTPQGGDAMEQEAQQAAERVQRDADTAGTDSNPPQHSLPLHRDTAPPRPAMTFALPAPPPQLGQPEPSQTATEERGSKPTPNAAQADARAVADRVYDLMRQEIILARQRGLGGRKG